MSAQLLLNQKPFIQLQIEELVKENRLELKHVEDFVDRLKERILSIDESKFENILAKEFKLPLIGRPNELGADYPKAFKFRTPEDVRLVGSIKTGTAMKNKTFIDIAITMPSKCIEKKDAKNQRYHKKRALYLAQLATILEERVGHGLIEKLEFRYSQGDILKPVLMIIPKNYKLKKLANFQLFIVVNAEDCPFKTSILAPSHGNLAPKWFFKDYQFDLKNQDEALKEFMHSESELVTSPFYNSSIISDLELIANSDTLFEQFSNQNSITEAIILTKIWLLHIGILKHFSFIVTMFIAHLQTKQIIHQNMSSFQIFKQIIKSLATKVDWSIEGFAYFEDSNDKIPEFKKHFPVVFISPSGEMNLCYNITSDLYQRLRHEANLADKLLSEPTPDIFDLLLLKKQDFYDKFDVITHLPKCTQKLPRNVSMLHKYMDHGIFSQYVYSEEILSILRQALTDRVQLVQQSPDHLSLDRKRWNIKCIPHDPANEETTFSFGLLLNPENSLRIIDIGPAANSAEAEEFRKFWEPKSQLRLQDGQISETVVWHVSTLSKRRDIIKFILTHALKKLNINQLTVLSTFLEKLITLNNLQIKKVSEEAKTKDHETGNDKVKSNKKRKRNDSVDVVDTTKYESRPLGLGDENYQLILKSYNELNKLLRNLDDMKYSITGIQSISTHLRSTSEFPPLQVYFQRKNKALKRKKGATLFPKDLSHAGKVLHLDPIEILVTLEGSGKWPSELDALEAAKRAYLIKVTESLRDKSYTVKLADAGSHLDILYGQFVYRIRLKCPKELSLCKEEFQRRRFELEIAPRVHEALQQLARERVAFSITCRIVKRWLSCQLLTDHLSELTIELLVAHLFLKPEPYTEPSSSSCGFRRFLELVARYDWKSTPLIVNFDNQIKIDEIKKLKNDMEDNRDKYPDMVLCTPFDKDSSPWTRSNPSKETLSLLIRLCNKGYEYFNQEVLLKPTIFDEYKALFRPNFKVFDLLIKLKFEVIQNFFMNFDAPKDFTLWAKESTEKKPSAFAVMPIVGVNFVEQYVGLLRENYGSLAWFFYDKYGQRLIGVMMKPDSEKELDGDMKSFIRNVKELGSKLVESVTIVKKESTINEDDYAKII